MTPQQHIDWVRDNVSWFESVPIDRLGVEVSNCPGWDVSDVFNHLTFGVGRSYPAALSKPPLTTANEVFVDVGRPAEYPIGAAVLSTFSTTMRRCIEAFESTDPETPCWTYAGPGTTKFWFRRAAIETALHRIDVEEALDSTQQPSLQNDRVLDALEETLEFAFPLAQQMTDKPEGRLTVLCPELGVEVDLGEGVPHGTITGAGLDVLAALWGRHRDRVTVSGDEDTARVWLLLIELAFAGR